MNKSLVLVFLMQILVSACVGSHAPLSAKERLDIFYKTDMPESSLVPFLVAGGQELVPLLIMDIPNQNIPKRRYVIAATGELMDDRALPALESVLLDFSEQDYVRCDALEALSQINSKFTNTLLAGTGVGLEELMVGCELY